MAELVSVAELVWPAPAVAALACPVCRDRLAVAEGGLVCGAAHRFDAARQGYVHLAAGRIRHPGDTAEMVAARERVCADGLFDGVTRALGGSVPASARVLLDLGAGTGHHLAGVLDLLGDPPGHPGAGQLADPARMRAYPTEQGEGPVGVAIDTSKHALRRAARAHPRLVAVAADATEQLPIRDGAVDAVLIAFAPRAAGELARVVRPGGVVVVATPAADHLAELRQPLGMLAVGEGKEEALVAALGPAFALAGRHEVRATVAASRATAVDLALMGPAGFHATAAELQARAGALTDPCPATIAVVVSTFVRAPSPG